MDRTFGESRLPGAVTGTPCRGRQVVCGCCSCSDDGTAALIDLDGTHLEPLPMPAGVTVAGPIALVGNGPVDRSLARAVLAHTLLRWPYGRTRLEVR